MTNKFTEEQYQEIINFEDFEVVYRLGIVDSFVGEIIPFIDKNELQQEAMAIANPLTREWAHEKFVEKEKKYLWSSKKNDGDNNVLTLYIDDEGMVSTSFRKASEPNLRNEDMWITESEIKVWGYNPEMFDREEV